MVKTEFSKYEYGDVIRCIKNDFNEPDFTIGDYYIVKAVSLHEGDIIITVTDKNGNTLHTMDKFEKVEDYLPSSEIKSDMVNNPPHYKVGTIEVIDFLEAWQLDFRLANVVKYVCRAEYKGSQKQDIEKAIWYLNRYYEKECCDNENK